MVTENLELDLSDALASVETLDSALTNAASNFQSALTDALQPLSNFTVENADASAVTSAIDDAITGASGVPVDVTADTTGAVDAIEALPSDVPPVDVPVTADTTDAQAQIDDLTNSTADLGAATDTTGSKAGDAAQKFQDLGAGAELGMGTGILAAAGLAFGLDTVFNAAVSAKSAEELLNDTLGPKQAAAISQVNIPGLTGNYVDLGRTVGDTAAQINTALTIAFLGARDLFGKSGTAAVDFGRNIVDLALNVQALHPKMGSVEDITKRLTTALFTGGRQLRSMGIQVTDTETKTQLLKDATAGLTDGMDPKLATAVARAEVAFRKLTNEHQNLQKEGKRTDTELDKTKNSLIDLAAGTIEPVVTPIIKTLGETFTSDTFQSIAPIVTRVGLALSSIGLSELIRNAPQIIGFFQNLPGYVNTAASAVSSFGADLGHNIGAGLSSAASAVSSFGADLGHNLLNAGRTAMDNFVNGLGVGVGAVGSFFQNLGGHIADGVSTAVGAIGRLTGAIGGIVGKIVNVGVSGAEAAIGTVGSLIGTIGGLGGKIVHVGEEGAEAAIGVVGNLIGTIASVIPKVVHVGVEGVEAAISAVGDLIGKIAGLVDKTVHIGVEIAGGVFGTSGPSPFDWLKAHTGQTGGPVPGSVGTAVPAIVHGGEYVLSADVVDRIKRGNASEGAQVGGGTVHGGSISIDTIRVEVLAAAGATPQQYEAAGRQVLAGIVTGLADRHLLVDVAAGSP